MVSTGRKRTILCWRNTVLQRKKPSRMTIVDTLRMHKGLLFCLLYSILMTCQMNLAKLLTYNSHSSWLMFLRSLAFVSFLPFIDWESSRGYTNRDLVNYILTSVTGILTHALNLSSFMYIGVGDATAIGFGGGLVLTVIVGHVVLGESLRCQTAVLVIIDCVGVFFVTKPSFIFMSDCESCSRNKEIGAAIALSGAAFSSIWPIFIRNLSKKDTLCCYLMSVTHGMFWMIMSGLWTSLECAWKIPETLTEIIILLLFLTTSTIQLVVGVISVEHEQVSVFGMCMTLSTAVSYLLQLTVFGEVFDIISIIGAILIIFCVACSSVYDIMKSD